MSKLHSPKQRLLSALCLSVACAAALLTAGATAASAKAMKPIPMRSDLSCNSPCSNNSNCSGMCSVCHPLNQFDKVCYIN
jgi:hypothetical protein